MSFPSNTTVIADQIRRSTDACHVNPRRAKEASANAQNAPPVVHFSTNMRPTGDGPESDYFRGKSRGCWKSGLLSPGAFPNWLQARDVLCCRFKKLASLQIRCRTVSPLTGGDDEDDSRRCREARFGAERRKAR